MDFSATPLLQRWVYHHISKRNNKKDMARILLTNCEQPQEVLSVPRWSCWFLYCFCTLPETNACTWSTGVGRFSAFLLGWGPASCQVRFVSFWGCKWTCPLKRDCSNRKYIFQPLIFRGHSFVFRGVNELFVKKTCHRPTQFQLWVSKKHPIVQKLEMHLRRRCVKSWRTSFSIV